MSKFHRPLTWFSSLLPISTLCLLIFLNIFLLGHEISMQGPNQIALIVASFVAIGVAFYHRISWKIIEQGIVQSIGEAVPALLVLLMIGVIAGCWLIGGIIPAMIYYGTKILHPSLFYFFACLFCIIVSLAVGSSWSTIATIGLVLVGIGKSFGLSSSIVTGAVISGAYFGNKISPLSDTVLLASNITGVATHQHIRFSLITNIPAIVLALILYLMLGIFYPPVVITCQQDIQTLQSTLQQYFYIHPFLFLVPCIVIYLSIRRMPAFLVLGIGAFLGCFLSIVFQSKVLCLIANSLVLDFPAIYSSILQALYGEVHIVTHHTLLDALLVSFGMSGMLPTIWLVLGAMVFGGVLHTTGMLRFIIEKSMYSIQTKHSLVFMTILSGLFLNMTTAEQYLAILMPGNLYKPFFKKNNIPLVHLSRALGDGATVTSPLIPWNACGAIQSSILNVSTLSYLPFAFFNIFNPIITLYFTYYPPKRWIRKLCNYQK